MTRDEFMELVYETFTDEPDNVLANGIIEAADAYAEHEKAQLSQEGTTFDMISRQAAIDAIANCTNCGNEKTLREYVTKHSLENGWTGGVLDALDAVKDQPTAQPEPQWIPVSERLPEESGCYIITAYDGVGHRTTFAKFQKKAKSWDLTGARSYWRVIAWMPLPKPFEGGTK